ncbi:MAG: MBL fold metallo-hydrolase RNA specificity domain-containing protein [Gammaproteobacteria bacterium]
MNIRFFGATREVTGACFLVETGRRRILVDCGLVQGTPRHERHNRDPFPFRPEDVDAVVLTHAHLDHSGRLPLLAMQGYRGPVHAHPATADLCGILLEDAAYLNEKDAEWENRKRERKGLSPVAPLYTRADVQRLKPLLRAIEYGVETEILDGIHVTLRDAGHILGSAIVELRVNAAGTSRRIVFTGDLGHRGAPILRDPELVRHADLVVMESTYGDRVHRAWDATWREMGEIVASARAAGGNILIPSFAVGRAQELLYVFGQHYEDWGLERWRIFLDSPLAIDATAVYARHARLHDARTREWLDTLERPFHLPNVHFTRTSEESMALNRLTGGAIIIAGSGMCTGGRIKHHLKHNAWRRQAHVMIVGFQAAGTLGRALVEGARHIRLWGETIAVNATVHTVGGKSAHADQRGLLEWYAHIEGRPPVVLVHGEPVAMAGLAAALDRACGVRAVEAAYGQSIAV